jgi:hypothetical protein
METKKTISIQDYAKKPLSYVGLDMYSDLVTGIDARSIEDGYIVSDIRFYVPSYYSKDFIHKLSLAKKHNLIQDYDVYSEYIMGPSGEDVPSGSLHVAIKMHPIDYAKAAPRNTQNRNGSN